jgi:hypothetical protein
MKCGERDWTAEMVGAAIAVYLIVVSVVGLWRMWK